MAEIAGILARRPYAEACADEIIKRHPGAWASVSTPETRRWLVNLIERHMTAVAAAPGAPPITTHASHYYAPCTAGCDHGPEESPHDVSVRDAAFRESLAVAHKKRHHGLGCELHGCDCPR